VWSSNKDNKLIGCTVTNATASRDEGGYIQSQGYVKVIGCNVYADNRSNELEGDKSSIYRTNSTGGLIAAIEVVGGVVKIDNPLLTPIFRFSGEGDYINLKAVKINGKVYSGNFLNQSGDKTLWYLSDLDAAVNT